MTNLETIMKDLESEWIQLPEEVRVACGQNYLEKCRVNIKLTNDSCVFVYLFLKYPKSGRLILYMDHPRWCNIHNVYPCYHCVPGNIDSRYDLIRFQ
jgi:hypothetical protein